MSQPYSSSDRGEIDATAPRLTPTSFLAAVALVGLLYFARDILVPFAIAVLLAFVLSIPVRYLQSRGLGRVFPVGLVVVLAFAMIFSIGAILTNQLATLAGDLPAYQSTIRDKIASLRKTASGHGPLERAAEMLQTLSDDVAAPAQPTRRPAEATPNAPLPVEITNTRTTPMQTMVNIVAPLIHPLASTGLVAVFVIFMLVQRGDLRNRAIRLAGSGDLQRTTAAMNEAAHRLSRFLLMQVLLNAAFGIAVGLGLWAIGVPSPVLWAILGAISRFVPYVGAALAATGPLVLAAAVDPNWTMLLYTAAFFVALEVTVGQLVEPLLFGHSTGLSPIAVVASITFWTWLWGPVGLLLATPLTACLVVLGRHVERLQFLEIMLGDRPPLTAAESFYQRALAGDAAEIMEGAEIFLKEHRLLTYYDEVAVRGLALAQVDLSRNALESARLGRIVSTLAEVIEELADHEEEEVAGRSPSGPDAGAEEGDDEDAQRLAALDREADGLDRVDMTKAQPPVRVLCVGGRNDLDRICADILAQALARHGIEAVATDLAAVGEQDGGDVVKPPADVVCLSYLDTTSPAHVRFAIRRLRRRFPDASLLLGSWGLPGDEARHLCEVARSDSCVSRLIDAVQSCLRLVSKARDADDAAETASAHEQARAADPRRLAAIGA